MRIETEIRDVNSKGLEIGVGIQLEIDRKMPNEVKTEFVAAHILAIFRALRYTDEAFDLAFSIMVESEIDRMEELSHE